MAGTSATSSAAVRRELDVKVLSVVRLHSTPRTDRAGSEEQDPAYDPRRVWKPASTFLNYSPQMMSVMCVSPLCLRRLTRNHS